MSIVIADSEDELMLKFSEYILNVTPCSRKWLPAFEEMFYCQSASRLRAKGSLRPWTGNRCMQLARSCTAVITSHSHL